MSRPERAQDPVACSSCLSPLSWWLQLISQNPWAKDLTSQECQGNGDTKKETISDVQDMDKEMSSKREEINIVVELSPGCPDFNCRNLSPRGHLSPRESAQMASNMR